MKRFGVEMDDRQTSIRPLLAQTSYPASQHKKLIFQLESSGVAY